MKIVGLTGSLAMGKTQTARFFAEEGIPVFDADAAVHELYAKDGKAVDAVRGLIPDAVVSGAVDRRKLAGALAKDEEMLSRLEAIVHPLVREEEKAFLARQRAIGAGLVVLDIPLLFETGRQEEVDAVVVASAPLAIQRRRALERPGMTEGKLARLLSRQMPDAEKRAKADFVVDTGRGFDVARAQVKRIVDRLR